MKKIFSLFIVILCISVVALGQIGHGNTAITQKSNYTIANKQLSNNQTVKIPNHNYRTSSQNYGNRASVTKRQEVQSGLGSVNKSELPKGQISKFHSPGKYFGNLNSDIQALYAADNRTTTQVCFEKQNMKFEPFKNMVVYSIWIADHYEWNSFYNCFAFEYGHMKFIIGCYTFEMGYWVRYEKDGKIHKRHIPPISGIDCSVSHGRSQY
ncbi:MAG: hypothetical protein WCM76_05510 [Bacteroidota bacterium]